MELADLEVVDLATLQPVAIDRDAPELKEWLARPAYRDITEDED